MKIAVIGSTNIDHIVQVPSLPTKGESILASAISKVTGGKGCNQAVALSKLGADVVFFSALKNDQEGKYIQQRLIHQGVNVDHIKFVDEVETGTAYITVSNEDNTIVVVPGANDHIDVTYIKQHVDTLESIDCIVLQNEIPIETISYIIQTYFQDKKIIYNPAPFRDMPLSDLQKCDYIIVNDSEYKQLNHTVDISSIRSKLIVTKGADGVWIVETNQHVPASQCTPIDPTGAGDAFVAGFTLAMSTNSTIYEAVHFANTVAAIATEAVGAQSSIPTRKEVNSRLQKNQT